MLSKLSTQQSKALEIIHEFLSQETDFFFKLEGFAGTGKSTLIARLCSELVLKQNLRIAIACPTHKALKNVKKMLIAVLGNNEINRVTFKTCASILGLQPIFDENSWEETFTSAAANTVSSFDVVIFDEFSMISSQQVDLIMKTGHPTKIIFVGDPAQLPPVKEDISVIASNQSIMSTRLTDVVRNSGDLLNLANSIRQLPRETPVQVVRRLIVDFANSQNSNIHILNEDDWLLELKNAFFNYLDRNVDNVRALAWTNKRVALLNLAIRQSLWNSKFPPAVCVNDLLVNTSPIFRPLLDQNGSTRYTLICPSSEEFQVFDFNIATRQFSSLETGFDSPVNWKTLKITSRTEISNANEFLRLEMLAPTHENERAAFAHSCKLSRNWIGFYFALKHFDRLTFAYALTVHRSQGSTFDSVFVDCKDILRSPDRVSLLYTALTRASRNAYLLI